MFREFATLALIGTGLIVLLTVLWLVRIYHACGNLHPTTVISAAIGSDPITRFAPDGEHYLTTEVCRRRDGEPNSYLCVQLEIDDKGADCSRSSTLRSQTFIAGTSYGRTTRQSS